MYGLMQVTKLGGGRYVGLPIHIANKISEGQNLKIEVDEKENILTCVQVTKEEYARADTARVRLRTSYDEQKWFRIPTAIVRTLDNDLWGVGEQLIVRYDPDAGGITVQPVAARRGIPAGAPL